MGLSPAWSSASVTPTGISAAPFAFDMLGAGEVGAENNLRHLLYLRRIADQAARLTAGNGTREPGLGSNALRRRIAWGRARRRV
jgi:hypothetical protein